MSNAIFQWTAPLEFDGEPSARDMDIAYTQAAAAEIALRLRMARRQGTAADYRAFAKLPQSAELADARGCTEPGREHFGSDSDYTQARSTR
jgi:trimethylamine:corrinoid methyltransferase-like protein